MPMEKPVKVVLRFKTNGLGDRQAASLNGNKNTYVILKSTTTYENFRVKFSAAIGAMVEKAGVTCHSTLFSCRIYDDNELSPAMPMDKSNYTQYLSLILSKVCVVTATVTVKRKAKAASRGFSARKKQRESERNRRSRSLI
eukprot:gb/GECG01007023.1/.p1 GENE.gb/GECG01007023.1/~~gb/GECG01007023.1/.p1  ORF type:complete len:141 (+),score=13.68 gb/GECG01007023.1/:1-423(+)